MTGRNKSTPRRPRGQDDATRRRPEKEYDVTELRLKLLANGYTPLRNRDKSIYLKDWPKVVVTEELIRSKDWARNGDKATGIRLDNGLAVIDVDVDDKAFVRKLMRKVREIVPVLQREDAIWLRRHSGKAKEAWFFRLDAEFNAARTCVFVAPGHELEDPKSPTGRVEFYGGIGKRQFGAFGAHSHERGRPVRWYGWRGGSPLDTPFALLPVLTIEQFEAIRLAAEDILKADGWTPQPPKSRGGKPGEWVYDLTPDMVFHCNDGRTRTLDQLRRVADNGREDIRCSMAWLEGAQAENATRGIVHLTRSGHVYVHDFGGASHCEAVAGPLDIEKLNADFAAMMARTRTIRRKGW